MATLQGGLLGPDPGALSPEQVEQLKNFKIQTRIANEKYLRTHKEAELLLSGFFRNSCQDAAWCLGLAAVGTAPGTFPFPPYRPPPKARSRVEEKKSQAEGSLFVVPRLTDLWDREMFLKRPDNILEFAADYFTDPRLPNKIHMQLIKDKNVA